MQLDPAAIHPSPFSERFPHHLARTPTVFIRDSLELLRERGIEDKTLDGLVAALPTGAIIAGGYLTSVLMGDTKASKDIDLFFTGAEPFAATVNQLLNPLPKPEREEGEKDIHAAWRGYELLGGQKALDEVNTARFLTFRHTKGYQPDLQLIRLGWYTDAAHVLDSFDITLSCWAVDSGGLTYLPAAFLDISRKRIVVRRLSFPASTLRRVIKYTKKGFYACPGSLAALCEQIAVFKGDLGSREVISVD